MIRRVGREVFGIRLCLLGLGVSLVFFIVTFGERCSCFVREIGLEMVLLI